MSESRKQSDDRSEYFGKTELLIAENSVPGYNKFIVKECIKYSEVKNFKHGSSGDLFRTLDFGAGFGTLALIWRELTGQDVECLEIDFEQIKEIKARGFITYTSTSMIEGKFRFIYSSNVLEHIEDDEKSLEELSALLDEGGRIAVYVPAFMVLFSELDVTVGHYRRYGKQELIEKVEKAGLKVVTCRYVDSVGYFASFVIKIFGWKSFGNIGNNFTLRLYDKCVFPISRIIDKITLGKIVGKNIFLVAEKKQI